MGKFKNFFKKENTIGIIGLVFLIISFGILTYVFCNTNFDNILKIRRVYSMWSQYPYHMLLSIILLFTSYYCIRKIK